MEHVTQAQDDTARRDAFVYSDNDDDDVDNNPKRGEREEYVSISLDSANDTASTIKQREEMAEAPIHHMMRWNTSPSLPPCLVTLLQHPRASWHLLVALFVSLALLVVLMSMR